MVIILLCLICLTDKNTIGVKEVFAMKRTLICLLFLLCFCSCMRIEPEIGNITNTTITIKGNALNPTINPPNKPCQFGKNMI